MINCLIIVMHVHLKIADNDVTDHLFPQCIAASRPNCLHGCALKSY